MGIYPLPHRDILVVVPHTEPGLCLLASFIVPRTDIVPNTDVFGRCPMVDISVQGTTTFFAQFLWTDIGLEKSEKHRGDIDQHPWTEMAVSIYGSKIGRWAARLSWGSTITPPPY